MENILDTIPVIINGALMFLSAKISKWFNNKAFRYILCIFAVGVIINVWFNYDINKKNQSILKKQNDDMSLVISEQKKLSDQARIESGEAKKDRDKLLIAYNELANNILSSFKNEVSSLKKHMENGSSSLEERIYNRIVKVLYPVVISTEIKYAIENNSIVSPYNNTSKVLAAYASTKNDIEAIINELANKGIRDPELEKIYSNPNNAMEVISIVSRLIYLSRGINLPINNNKLNVLPQPTGGKSVLPPPGIIVIQ
jgi:hypothetical protein